ncbi:MAG: cell division protein FtsA [Bacteroidales bacterium]|nr:cell division protein FtsA [Bacteroidales bacterium]
MDERHIVAIDLGTSKFAVTVAKVEGDNMQVIYYREHKSDGIRESRVFAPKKATNVLENAIREAEEELGLKIRKVVVGMPRYQVSQASATMRVTRNPGECITEEEVRNFKEIAMDTYPMDDRPSEILLGAVAQSFSNGEEFQLVEDDIIGTASDYIDGNFKLFIGKSKPLDDIDLAFKMIGITVVRKYFTPDTTAKAVLRESEIDNGVALVELGGGVTSATVYYGGIMRHYASIPFGGKLITKDIKSEASISETLAENIKLAYGACMPDRLQHLSEKVLYINSVPAKQLSVKYLSEIITARTREIINAILYEIEQSGFPDNLKSGIVITGGGANLTNCCNLIKEMSGYNVRKGYPRSSFFTSECNGVTGTEAATSIGMLLSAKGESAINCGESASGCHEAAHKTEKSVIGTDVQADKDIAHDEALNPANHQTGTLEMDFQEISEEEKKRKKEEEDRIREAERIRKERGKKPDSPKVSWLTLWGEKIKTTANKAYRSITEEDV